MKPSKEITFLLWSMLLIFVAATEKDERLSSGMNVLRGTQGRIVGGDDAYPGEFPSYVNAVICGGTLIRPNIVLTAAHCADAIMNVGYVFVPGYKRKGNASEKMTVDKVISHPNYNDRNFKNDIAIVVLTKCVKIPVLQRLNTDPKVPSGDAPVTVIGLGYLSGNDEKLPKVLQKVDVSVIGSKKYKKWYKGVQKIFARTQICAGTVKGGKDACFGDSGGPLLMKGEYSTVDGTQDRRTQEVQVVTYTDTIQVGLVSKGIPCALRKIPKVYTRVSKYIDFIEKNIEAYSNCTIKE